MREFINECKHGDAGVSKGSNAKQWKYADYSRDYSGSGQGAFGTAIGIYTVSKVRWSR